MYIEGFVTGYYWPGFRDISVRLFMIFDQEVEWGYGGICIQGGGPESVKVATVVSTAHNLEPLAHVPVDDPLHGLHLLHAGLLVLVSVLEARPDIGLRAESHHSPRFVGLAYHDFTVLHSFLQFP